MRSAKQRILQTQLLKIADTRLLNLPWPWNPGQGSLKVIESDTIR